MIEAAPPITATRSARHARGTSDSSTVRLLRRADLPARARGRLDPTRAGASTSSRGWVGRVRSGDPLAVGMLVAPLVALVVGSVLLGRRRGWS